MLVVLSRIVTLTFGLILGLGSAKAEEPTSIEPASGESLATPTEPALAPAVRPPQTTAPSVMQPQAVGPVQINNDTDQVVRVNRCVGNFGDRSKEGRIVLHEFEDLTRVRPGGLSQVRFGSRRGIWLEAARGAQNEIFFRLLRIPDRDLARLLAQNGISPTPQVIAMWRDQLPQYVPAFPARFCLHRGVATLQLIGLGTLGLSQEEKGFRAHNLGRLSYSVNSQPVNFEVNDVFTAVTSK